MYACLQFLTHDVLMYIQNQNQGLYTTGREDESSLYITSGAETTNSLYVQRSSEEDEAHCMYSIYWLAN